MVPSRFGSHRAPLTGDDPPVPARHHTPIPSNETKGQALSDALNDLIQSGQAATLEAVMQRPAWRQKAACRGKPTAWFFPEVGDSTEKAKIICAGCTVAVERHAQAVEGSEHGIWAGTPARARQNLKNAA